MCMCQKVHRVHPLHFYPYLLPDRLAALCSVCSTFLQANRLLGVNNLWAFHKNTFSSSAMFPTGRDISNNKGWKSWPPLLHWNKSCAKATMSTQLAQAECARNGHDHIQDHTADNTNPCNISIISWPFSNRTVQPPNSSKAITMSSIRVHNFRLLLWVKWDLCSSGILHSIRCNSIIVLLGFWRWDQ